MSSITVRFIEPEDQPLLVEWLQQPGVSQWFPLVDLREVEDAVRIWMAYGLKKAGLMALWDGVPCGTAVLNLQTDAKLAHQCLLSILVDEKYRGRGVGTQLLKDLMVLAKENFRIELLHLEVYQGNPAIRLYERTGFVQYAIHPRFMKELDGRYLDKVMMQRAL